MVTRRIEKITAIFILILPVSIMFSNLIVIPFDAFVFTFQHFMLVGAVFLSFFNLKKRISAHLIFLLFIMLISEILHSIISGFALEIEWLKSFAQYMVYIASFYLLIRIKIHPKKWQLASIWFLKFILIVCIVNIMVFIINNTLGLISLPSVMLVNNTINLTHDFRYLGIFPNIGLATEPSLQALGLIISLAFIHNFYRRGFYDNIYKIFIITNLLILINIISSFSMTGLFSIILLFSLLFLSNLSKWKLVSTLTYIIVILLFVSLTIQFVNPTTRRTLAVMQGRDSSTKIRLFAPYELMISQSSTIERTLFGTGLGLENRESKLYHNIYQKYYLVYRDEVKVANILSAIRILQGFIGVIVFISFIIFLLKPLFNNIRVTYSIISINLIVLFSSGYFLSPFFWGLLVTNYAMNYSKYRYNKKYQILSLQS
jgi:hypothetical protein